MLGFVSMGKKARFGLLVLAILVFEEVKGESGLDQEGNKSSNEEKAEEWLRNKLEPEYSKMCNIQAETRWDYATNVTKETEAASVDAMNRFTEYQRQVQKYITENFPDRDTYKPDLRRELKLLSLRGPGNMTRERAEQLNKIGVAMEAAYASAKVCKYGQHQNKKTCKMVDLEPDIVGRFRESNDFNELAYYWTAWHDALNKAIPTPTFTTYVELLNEGSQAINFTNTKEYWIDSYNDFTPEFTSKRFEKQIETLWKELQPHYETIHAYVRMKLRENPSYAQHFSDDGCIPANLLGNVWAQQWSNIGKLTKPYSEVAIADATEAMKKSDLTVEKIVRTAEDFFTGLGLDPMTDVFWNKSMTERPKDGRTVVCHASAEDFCLGSGGRDFRIKMCTTITQDDLVTVHHEMGHIEYFMQYANQSITFRDGANPGFHEAIGDTLALAVTTPKHLQCVLGYKLGMDKLCDENQASSTSSSSSSNSSGSTSSSNDSDSTGDSDSSRSTSNSDSDSSKSTSDTDSDSSKSTSNTSDSFKSTSNTDSSNSTTKVSEQDINYLYYMALDKLVFFPFAYSMDSWRWGVFDGSIPENKYNEKWWEIRGKLQGIKPPSPRNASNCGLDAAAKYHIVAGVEYMRYFISHLLQFQFYEAMCVAAGEFKPDDPDSKPLHQCDFSGSKEAGKLIRDMMVLGSSKPWPEALQAIAGTSEMKTDSVIRYFKPLLGHLKKVLEEKKEKPGFSCVK